MAAYGQNQRLNLYLEMLHGIYGSTQNYAKSKYEILSHLSEVTGVAGKYIFRKGDVAGAAKFIPKIFGWACALLKSVNPRETDLEAIVLRKFPGVCPYCLKQPCSCWASEKPTLDPAALDAAFYKNAPSKRRSINDMELMFKEIYGDTWSGKNKDQPRTVYTYLRLVEELAEVAEAVRFSHLYPKNFENELADFIAWWFALAISIREAGESTEATTDILLWRSYPGQCQYCESAPCFCQQGPVRELMSRPAPGQYHEIDLLTALRNQASYTSDLAEIASKKLIFTLPIACVRCDADHFKGINDKFGHPAGDVALKLIASVLRSKAGPRHRLYRISGDEFGLLMPDSSEDEAVGMMRRVLHALRNTDAEWTSPEGKVEKFTVSLSVGVSECTDPTDIEAAFTLADRASYESKRSGRDRVSRASDLRDVSEEKLAVE